MPRSAATRQRRARDPKVKFDFTPRASGILLHPTSLPGPHGSGDVGPKAHAFVDFLAAAGQRWWQMLPVGPPGDPPGNSPYSSYSAFAGSAWLISPELLREDGLLGREDLRPTKSLNARAVDYVATNRHRGALLRRAFENFTRDRARHAALDAYCDRERSWLDDFVVFSALKQAHGGREWLAWPRDVKLRQTAALERARRDLAEEIRFYQFCQYVFDRQWSRLRAHCHANKVGLIGDIPIFVALDSCDVWANPELFLLDASARPKFLSGAPPDDFCPEGQSWGHPQYRWDAHRRSGFAWWIARFESMMRRFDGVRIDHFLGFNRTWGVPRGAKTARRGTWLAGPRKTIFDAVRRALGDVPIIAEDLGAVTPEASALRDACGFPGMRVMQFGFGPGGDFHLPHRYPRHCVAYTGTHDNNTTAGWFAELGKRNGHASSSQRAEREKAMRYLKAGAPAAVPWEMIRTVMMSVADTVIVPVQDVLGLGAEARMNVPGTADANWTWRLPPGKLTPALAARLRQLAELYDRV